VSDLKVSLLPWQIEVWNNEARFHVIAAGRRCGKSRYACNRLLVEALASDKGHVFYVAPTQGQARDIMWSMLLELGEPVITQTHINNMQVKLMNGSTISLKGADRPETMKGVSLKFVVLDEFAEMKPVVWEEVLRPALADLKGKAVFIGTPTGRNHFWEIYQHARLGDDPDWAGWHFTSFDNPILDPEEINSAKATMGSFAFHQEFMASFEARDSALFQDDWLKFSEEEPSVGDVFMSIDPAGFEDANAGKKKSRLDETAICITKVNDDGWYVKEIIHGRWSLKETAEKIFDAVIKHRPLRVGIERGIAQQAIMSPLTDMMNSRNRWFRVDLLTHGNKKKVDRIVWALQGRMERGKITLNKGDWNTTFMDQLFQFPSKLTHDDLIDALAYIDQIVENCYAGNIEELDDYEMMDEISGY
jgi:predicted phage terminase large subunit-like protein